MSTPIEVSTSKKVLLTKQSQLTKQPFVQEGDTEMTLEDYYAMKGIPKDADISGAESIPIQLLLSVVVSFILVGFFM